MKTAVKICDTQPKAIIGFTIIRVFLQQKRKNVTANFQLGCIYSERKGAFSLIFAATQ